MCYHIDIISAMNLLLISVMMVSFACAQMKYPSEREILVQKDGNVLLNREFLPYLNECPTANDRTELCSMYYDMVYNVYDLNLNGNETKAAILKASQDLENPSLIKKFCDIFHNESSNALDKQPFSQANGINNIVDWIKVDSMCDIHCKYSNRTEIKIKDVCKYISGGLKWISKQKYKKIDLNIPVNANNKTNGKANDDKQNNENVVESEKASNSNVNPQSIPNESANQSTNTNANTASNSTLPNASPIQGKPIDIKGVSKQQESSVPAVPLPPSAKVTPKLHKNNSTMPVVNKEPVKTNTKQDNDPKKISLPNKQTPPAAIQNEDEDYEKKTEYSENNTDNEDDLGGENHEDEQEQPADPNSNNKVNVHSNINLDIIQNSISADQVSAFREDQESNFFPYFMFLMFVTVTFYVVHHNKSKILALLIEGRRSRNTSRSGGRRKHSSAEYRKLDSNLEEAIQSDGSHVLSTQIIY